jgi:hypothetical protein
MIRGSIRSQGRGRDSSKDSREVLWEVSVEAAP